MKLFLLTLLLTLQFVCHGAAVYIALPDVPPSTLTADKVLAIARKQFGNKADRLTLVGLDWCKPSQFRPRYTTGEQYTGLSENPDVYCWFVTFLERSAPKANGQPGKPNEVILMRIKDDGTVQLMESIT